MANNCYNYITINGNVAEIKKFSKMLEIDLSKGQEPDDLYENLCADFGKQEDDARWFSMNVHSFDSPEEITISGDSAWSPCLLLFHEITKRFTSFKIRYEYEEMSSDFAGFADITNDSFADNCFGYWEGIIATQGETDALEQVLNNEMECYDTEEELIESDMYLAFSEESKKEILETYNEINS
ncbi:MAG: hypothetical protein RL311_821 [Bacteroidota bacterium]|jgi:hypothetical protein